MVAVTKGLSDGDQVVTDGVDKLKDGAKIEVREPGAKKNAGSTATDPAAAARAKNTTKNDGKSAGKPGS
jgi:multidrug efflux system membrane fusion protein